MLNRIRSQIACEPDRSFFGYLNEIWIVRQTDVVVRVLVVHLFLDRTQAELLHNRILYNSRLLLHLIVAQLTDVGHLMPRTAFITNHQIAFHSQQFRSRIVFAGITKLTSQSTFDRSSLLRCAPKKTVEQLLQTPRFVRFDGQSVGGDHRKIVSGRI